MPIVMLLALLGCPKTAPAPVAPPPAPEPEPVVEVAMLETPFTAEQIRGAFVEGMALTMRLTEGKEVTLHRWHVAEANETGCTIEVFLIDSHGEAQSDPVAAEAEWNELRDHARFETARTIVEPTNWVGAVGSLSDCHKYSITAGPDDPPGQVETYVFCDELPGPPIRYAVEADGVVSYEQVMMERTPPKESD